MFLFLYFPKVQLAAWRQYGGEWVENVTKNEARVVEVVTSHVYAFAKDTHFQ